MTPCILIAYNAFTGENCCLHARSETPGSTSLHAYEITAPSHAIGNFDDTSEWDIVAVVELPDLSETCDPAVDIASIGLRIHIDEIDVTESYAPQTEE